MADNAQKKPFALLINDWARQKVQDQIQITGKALPCRVTAVDAYIVTVQIEVRSGFTFPLVTVPIATSRYARPPVQIGDTGVVRSIDTYLGGVSGLGGGTASLTQRGNLSSLVYEPVAEASWTTPNPNAYLVTAPDGAIIQTDDGTGSIVVSQGTVTITGDLVINGKRFVLHEHTNGNMGGDTGGVVP